MRVTFPRLPDHERAYALVERDDGAVYRLYGGPAGRPLPHDIRHLVVERELHIPDGIWGGIAAGLVFDSMQHVSGRRPPHARRRSAELLASFGPRGLRAEALANFVEGVAGLDHPSAAQILTLAATRLSVLPDRGRGPGRDRRGRAGPAGRGGPLGQAAGRGGAQLRMAADPARGAQPSPGA